MVGIQRFFLLILCVALVMICYPDYGIAGWTFAGTLILVWTGIILIMSVVGSLFGLYRFDGINRFLTWVFLLCVLASLLMYFPQDDNQTPLQKLQQGNIPTGADIQKGLNKFTFNFAFDRRNARSDKNFINQQDAKKAAEEATRKDAEEAARKAAKKALQKLEIIVDDK